MVLCYGSSRKLPHHPLLLTFGNICCGITQTQKCLSLVGQKLWLVDPWFLLEIHSSQNSCSLLFGDVLGTQKGILFVLCPVFYTSVWVHAQFLSCVQLFATTWTVACQAPLSMGFSLQKYWSGLPFPPPADLSDPGIKSMSLASPALAGRFCTTEPLGLPVFFTRLEPISQL